MLGNKIGTTYVEGLADTKNINDFDHKLEVLQRSERITSASEMNISLVGSYLIKQELSEAP